MEDLLRMGAEEDKEMFIPITLQEEKELRRVFEHLCDFGKKAKLSRELLELKQTMALNRIMSKTQQSDIDQINRNEATQARLEEITKEMQHLENIPVTKKITVSDVSEKLKELNQKISKKDVEEMIWEVDEDLDQSLVWDEFRLMFTRSIADRSGLEPSRMVSGHY